MSAYCGERERERKKAPGTAITKAPVQVSHHALALPDVFQPSRCFCLGLACALWAGTWLPCFPSWFSSSILQGLVQLAGRSVSTYNPMLTLTYPYLSLSPSLFHSLLFSLALKNPRAILPNAKENLLLFGLKERRWVSLILRRAGHIIQMKPDTWVAYTQCYVLLSASPWPALQFHEKVYNEPHMWESGATESSLPRGSLQKEAEKLKPKHLASKSKPSSLSHKCFPVLKNSLLTVPDPTHNPQGRTQRVLHRWSQSPEEQDSLS